MMSIDSGSFRGADSVNNIPGFHFAFAFHVNGSPGFKGEVVLNQLIG